MTSCLLYQSLRKFKLNHNDIVLYPVGWYNKNNKHWQRQINCYYKFLGDVKCTSTSENSFVATQNMKCKVNTESSYYNLKYTPKRKDMLT